MNKLSSALLITALASGLASANPSTDTWRFQVLLDDRPMGTHTFEVARSGNSISARSIAKFRVKALFVTLFSYDFDATEQWQDGCIKQLHSATREGSERTKVEAARAEPGFQIKVNGEASVLTAPCVSTFSYWRPAFLQQQQLLNPQTGEYDPVTIRRLGNETVDLLGQAVLATRYTIAVQDERIDVWYEADSDRWIALESITADGNVIRYVAEQLPSSEAGGQGSF